MAEAIAYRVASHVKHGRVCQYGVFSRGAAQERVAADPQDPWEGFNRRVFAFNDVLDRYALKPVARGYKAVTPEPVQTGVGLFST